MKKKIDLKISLALNLSAAEVVNTGERKAIFRRFQKVFFEQRLTNVISLRRLTLDSVINYVTILKDKVDILQLNKKKDFITQLNFSDVIDGKKNFQKKNVAQRKGIHSTHIRS